MTVEPEPKKHRTKSYEYMHSIHKMLQNSTGRGLEVYFNKNPDGSLKDPYTWNYLGLCRDNGGDMLCNAFYMKAMGMNIDDNSDEHHDVHNDFKNATKDVKEWSHCLLMCAAYNAPWGSK